MALLTLGLLNLGRNVGVALLHPVEQPESETYDDCLDAKPEEWAQFPAKLAADECLEGGELSEIGKAGIEGDEHASEGVGRELVDHPRSDVENPSRCDVLH